MMVLVIFVSVVTSVSVVLVILAATFGVSDGRVVFTVSFTCDVTVVAVCDVSSLLLLLRLFLQLML